MSIRVYDIPHASSRAVQFTASITAPFAGGSYAFAGAWTDLAVEIPLRRGIYVVRSIKFGADVAEQDWTSNIVTMPRIWFGLTESSLASLFRFPLPLSTYDQGSEFNETIRVTQEPGTMKARITGELSQSLSLVGKADITAFVTLTAYEIVDDAWITQYLKGWTP